jgi:hypothetical protein
MKRYVTADIPMREICCLLSDNEWTTSLQLVGALRKFVQQDTAIRKYIRQGDPKYTEIREHAPVEVQLKAGRRAAVLSTLRIAVRDGWIESKGSRLNMLYRRTAKGFQLIWETIADVGEKETK